MNHLMNTILETREALDKVPDDKKVALVDSLFQLTRRMVDDVVQLNDIPEHYLSQIEPIMSNQILAAEKRTEKAANDILAATENIMSLLPAVQGPVKQDIQNQVNALFEASNFQDLVSQHLNEIKLRLDQLNKDMQMLSDVMAGLSSGKQSSSARAREPRRSDAHLLNGPTTKL